MASWVKRWVIVCEPVRPTFTASDRQSAKDSSPYILFFLVFPPCPPCPPCPPWFFFSNYFFSAGIDKYRAVHVCRQLDALVDLGDVVRLQLRDHLGAAQFESGVSARAGRLQQLDGRVVVRRARAGVALECAAHVLGTQAQDDGLIALSREPVAPARRESQQRAVAEPRRQPAFGSNQCGFEVIHRRRPEKARNVL